MIFANIYNKINLVNMSISKQKVFCSISGQEISTDNVKLSNFYFEKIITQKACQCAFSLMVVAL